MYKKFILFLFLNFLMTMIYAETEKLIRDPFVPMNNSINTSINLNTAPLHEIWVPLLFANVTETAEFLSNKTNGLLSINGQVHADTLSNQLWIRDDDAHLTHVKKIIAHLDQPQPQFLIKAKILTLDRQYEHTLGIQFNTADSTTPSTDQLNMDLPHENNSDRSFTFSIAKLPSHQLLNLQLSALEQEGHALLIANPSLITLNKKTASIESGAEVPYEEATASGATSINFKKAVLRLKVTPQWIDRHRMLLHIALNEDKVSAITVKGVPAIQTQQMTTEVIANDNQTIVLGGILEDSHAKQLQEIPVLSKIPIMGVLFRHYQQLSQQQTLLIFLTPMILRE